MEEEFKRFGLPNISLFIAFSQLSGSIGLIFGLFHPTIDLFFVSQSSNEEVSVLI